MPVNNMCPDPAQIAQLFAGDLPDETLDAICEHVTVCLECTTKLRTLSEEQSVLHAISSKESTWPTDLEDRAAIEKLIAQWSVAPLDFEMQLGPESQDASVEKEERLKLDELARQLLHPPKSTGELGWLGTYRVLGILGSGGMGVVVEAEDPHLSRRVAVKAMQPSLLRREEHRRRFLREARAAASLNHDNIVPIHAVGEDGDVLFLVMPLLKGESLENRLRREGQLSVVETVRIGKQIAAGIAAAHECGLIHRDIKPANIWLEHRGQELPRVKILDFGLARAEDDESNLTITGSIPGTPAFMAPEQARGESANARSDLFSLGCVLYTMIAGKPPFTGRNAAALMFAVINHRPDSLHDIEPHVPEKLAFLVMRLLEKDPALRLPKAVDVAEALLVIENEASRLDPRETGNHADRSHGQSTSPSIFEEHENGDFPTDLDDSILSDGKRHKSRHWMIGATVAVLLMSLGVMFAVSGVNKVQTRFELKNNFIGSDTAAGTQKNGRQDETPAATVVGLAAVPLGTSADIPFPGLVPRPVPMAGFRRWQVDTRAPRGDIFAVAWDPDGRRIACGSPIGNVRIIDAKTSSTLSIIPAHTGSVWAMDWSPIEDRLVTVGEDGAVRLFDPQGKLRSELGTHVGTARAVGFSPDGSWIASGGIDAKIRLWRTTGEPGPILSGHSSQVDGIAWHPTGKKLASASLDGTVRIWNVDGTWNVNGIRGPELKGHLGGVLGLSWSPDGELLASAGVDGAILLWRNDGTKHSVSSGQSGVVTAISWGKNGLIATSGEDNTIRLWQRDGSLFKTQKLEVRRINDLEWSRDGSRLAVATDSQGIRVLNESGEWESAIPLDTISMRAISFNHKGELATAGDDGFVGVWNTDGTLNQQLRWHAKSVNSVNWNPDGSQLVTGSWESSIRVWDVKGDTIATRNGTHPTAWNPAGTEIAWTSGEIIMLAENDAPPRVLHGHKTQVIRLIWNSNGTQLASSDVSGEIRMWNRNGSSAGEIQADPMILALAWHPKQPLLVSGCTGHGNIQLWSLDSKLIKTWKAHVKGVIALDWSPDGEKLLSSSYDQRLCIWNKDGNHVVTLPGPTAIGCAGVWNPTGRQVATAHIDGVVNFWDGDTFEPISTNVIFNDGNWARFDSKGLSDASDPTMVDGRLVAVVERESGEIELMSLSQLRNIFQTSD